MTFAARDPHPIPAAARLLRALLCLSFSLALGAAPVGFAACAAPEPSIHASDYSSKCHVARDLEEPVNLMECVVISDGPISCCSAECDGKAAISGADFDRYQEDLIERAPECGGIVCPNVACPKPLAFCDDTGTCQVGDTCGDPMQPTPCK